MTRAPFCSGRDTLAKRQRREQTQAKVKKMLAGSLFCDTELDNTIERLPYSMVMAKPSIFRPTTGGSKATYHIDAVFDNIEYPLLLIENTPRIAKFQPELRAIHHPDGSFMHSICRTASNVPLHSHLELKKHLQSLVGKGPVIVNLTPASVDRVVAVVGAVMMNDEDDLPIVSPIPPVEVVKLLGDLNRCPLAQSDTEVYTATVVSDAPSLKRGRSKEAAVSLPSQARSHTFSRKGIRHENKETRKAKLRRLNNAVSV